MVFDVVIASLHAAVFLWAVWSSHTSSASAPRLRGWGSTR